MDSIGEIIEQQSLSEPLIVESRSSSPLSVRSGNGGGGVTPVATTTIVMVGGTVIGGMSQPTHHHHHSHHNNNNGTSGSGNHQHQQHQLHQQHQQQQQHHQHHQRSGGVTSDDCSTETAVSAVSLGPLTVQTTMASRSRIISHGHGLELIKQEHHVAHTGGTGGRNNSVDSLNDHQELSQDDCSDVLNDHHDHHSHHHQQQQHQHLHHQQQQQQHHHKHEALSVIVQPLDDSRDSSSQLLSPGKMTPTSSDLIDTSDFRALHEPTYQTLTSVNGRMSPPGFSPNSSYATLTPLQPLPPISTMSDKFAYGHASNVSGSFTVMQNNGMGGISLGLAGVNSPYNYDKLPSMGMSPPHNYSSPTNTLSGMGMSQQPSPLSPQSTYSQNGLHSPQKSMSPSGYESPYHHRDMLGGGGVADHRQVVDSPQLSPQSGSLHSPGGGGNTMGGSFGSSAAVSINGMQGSQCSPSLQPLPLSSAPQQQQQHSTPPGLVQIASSHMQHRDAITVVQQTTQSPSPPPILTIQSTAAVTTIQQQQQQHHQNVAVGKAGNNGPTTTPVTVTSINSDVEEINTKELAQRISAELKRYSIPQAIFAQRVLCRSQGTLSDLLRNPKPWSKLKSGRETFRRMFKWLQEPEFQRMSALRMAGEFFLDII